MIKTRLFQKYFLMATSLILVFIVLGFAFNNFILDLLRPKAGNNIPPIFIAKIVDRLNPQDKVKALQELESWQPNPEKIGENQAPRGPKLALVDQAGHCLFPVNCALNFDWNTISLPVNNYDFTIVKNNDGQESPSFRFPFFGPPPGGPGGLKLLNETVVIRLNNNTPLFLILINGLPPFPPVGPGPLMPLMGLGSLVLSLVLGVGLTIAIIYNSVRKGVFMADSVINELKGGNLKARFQITRKDEFGKAMLRFNTMADEIENLVTGLKTSEQARTKVLQELAHDLRTPLASLRNLVDTLQTRIEKLDASTRSELLTLSLKEIDYFERLVEDLLFLAQLKEPNYAAPKTSFNLSETIFNVADDCLFLYSQKGKVLQLHENLQSQTIEFPGDSHPITRLVRNAFENACSYAKSSITVKLENVENKMVRITIADDGPGFNPEDLLLYGQRSISRKLATNPDGRVSLGLGSVVIKTICEVYHGSLVVRNNVDGNGAVSGAEVVVELPFRG